MVRTIPAGKRFAWQVVVLGLMMVLGYLLAAVAQPFLVPPEVQISSFCGPEEEVSGGLHKPLRTPTDGAVIRNDPQSPAVNWSVNSHGLRDEPFPVEKPNGTVRILVIGDSQTEGAGLNVSDRYTDRLEVMLNSRFDTDIRIITAGRAGTSMKEYYFYLYNYGMAFDPDIVVVSFQMIDDISAERITREHLAVMAEHNLSAEEGMTEAADRAAEKRIRRIMDRRTWRTSDIRRYGNLIHHVATSAGADAAFFLLRPRPSHHWADPIVVDRELYGSMLAAWAEVCGRTVLTAPDKLADASREASRYTFRNDSHYNPRGNRVLAEGLEPMLVSMLRERGVE